MSDAPDQSGSDDEVTGREHGRDQGITEPEGEAAADHAEDTQPVVPPSPPGLPPPPSSVAVQPAAPPPQLPSAPVSEAAGARPANPAAIAALVVGIVAVPTGLLFITAPLGALAAILALALGGVGITKARRTNASGMGMSIGGMATGLIGLIAASVWLALGISAQSAAQDPRPLAQQIQSAVAEFGGETARPVDSLAGGECFDQLLNEPDVQRALLIDCGQPHRYEVFAVLRVDAGPNVPYPGVRELRKTADSHCKSEPFASFVGGHFFASPLEVSPLFPNPAAWANGDREIICLISDPAGPTTGTLRGYGRVTETPRARATSSPLPVHPVTPAPVAPPT